jgi:membrane protein DedA with SNARE-associated domain
VRTFISLPAGVAKMPFWRFTVLTFLGCLPWMLMLTYIGMQVGSRWEDWKDNLHYVDYAVVAAILIGVAYLVIKRRRPPRAGEGASSDLGAPDAPRTAPDAGRGEPATDAPRA